MVIWLIPNVRIPLALFSVLAIPDTMVTEKAAKVKEINEMFEILSIYPPSDHCSTPLTYFFKQQVEKRESNAPPQEQTKKLQESSFKWQGNVYNCGLLCEILGLSPLNK